MKKLLSIFALVSFALVTVAQPVRLIKTRDLNKGNLTIEPTNAALKPLVIINPNTSPPDTLIVTSKGLDAYATNVVTQYTVVTGDTVKPQIGTNYIKASADTLATLKIWLPADSKQNGVIAAKDGQIMTFYFQKRITSLSFFGNAIANAPTSMNAGTAFRLQYILANNLWLRLD